MGKTNNKIKHSKAKLIIAILALILAVSAILFGATDISKNNKAVVAKINGKKIYQWQVEKKLADIFQNKEDSQIDISQFPKEVLETILTDIYVQQKLEQQAQNSKVAQNKEIKQKVKDYKNQLLLKTYIDSIIAKKVNNDAIHNKYIELTSDFSGKKEMHIKHILVKDKGLADKIYKELISKNKKSASFEELAKKYSLDKSNSDLGGDLGYVILDNLDEDFAKAVENLEKGKISKEIKTKFGWHIVKVEGVRKVEIPDFESIKPEIEHRLKQQAMEKIFKDIASEAKIEIIIDLKPEEKLEKKPEEEIAKEDENNDQNKAKNESLDTEKNEAK